MKQQSTFPVFHFELTKTLPNCSFLHQIILDLSHKPKCIPNRLQTTGVAHQSPDRFIELKQGCFNLPTGSTYPVLP